MPYLAGKMPAPQKFYHSNLYRFKNMMNFTAFYLTIQQVEKLCLFQLSWGQGQNLNDKTFVVQASCLLNTALTDV
ncbi:MAG: hypothetical protein ACKO9I_21245, partial [Sphaerospermopsis kisseleviana]